MVLLCFQISVAGWFRLHFVEESLLYFWFCNHNVVFNLVVYLLYSTVILIIHALF